MNIIKQLLVLYRRSYRHDNITSKGRLNLVPNSILLSICYKNLNVVKYCIMHCQSVQRRPLVRMRSRHAHISNPALFYSLQLFNTKYTLHTEILVNLNNCLLSIAARCRVEARYYPGFIREMDLFSGVFH